MEIKVEKVLVLEQGLSKEFFTATYTVGSCEITAINPKQEHWVVTYFTNPLEACKKAIEDIMEYNKIGTEAFAEKHGLDIANF